jgi:hypothetical protein
LREGLRGGLGRIRQRLSGLGRLLGEGWGEGQYGKSRGQGWSEKRAL